MILGGHAEDKKGGEARCRGRQLSEFKTLSQIGVGGKRKEKKVRGMMLHKFKPSFPQSRDRV